MPRLPASLLALLLGAVAAFGLASCGEEDAQLLPGETAREITTNLDAVEQLSDEGDCTGAESAAQQVSEQIEALSGVDRRLKRALEDGATRLNEVIAGCEEPATEAIAPATIPPESEEEEREPGSEEENRDEDRDGDGGGEKDGDGDGGEGGSEGESAPEAPSSPSLPPQAEGEGKGPEGGGPPQGEEGGGEGSSGGLSPGSPAGEGE